MVSPNELDAQIQAAEDRLRAEGVSVPLDWQVGEIAAAPGEIGSRDIAAAIEHTLLAPDATPAQVRELCEEARRFDLRGVCVNPVHVPDAVEHLVGAPCEVVSVVGFPLGASLPQSKADEARRLLQAGAHELDMVLHVGGIKSEQHLRVEQDVRDVVEAAGSAPVKVIIEACLLSREEKIRACLLSAAAGAAFVKTSTGFSRGGATLEDVELMCAVARGRMGVKAAGGIRDLATAKALLRAGASRLGCSRSLPILEEALAQGSNGDVV